MRISGCFTPGEANESVVNRAEDQLCSIVKNTGGENEVCGGGGATSGHLQHVANLVSFVFCVLKLLILKAVCFL